MVGEEVTPQGTCRTRQTPETHSERGGGEKKEPKKTREIAAAASVKVESVEAPTAAQVCELVQQGGATPASIAKALSCECSLVVAVIEELQLDGAMYEREGVLHML